MLNCICVTCSKQFKSHSSKVGKFCSKACYLVAIRAGLYNRGSNRKHTCFFCKKEFDNKSFSTRRDGSKSDKKFCSRSCYDNYRSAITKNVYGNCGYCNKELTKNLTGSYASKYCSWDCRILARRASPKKCICCGTVFTPITFRKSTGKYISVNSRHTCSKECNLKWISKNEERKKKISLAFSGSNHPNWQGGAPASNRGYRGAGWSRIRKKVLERDNYQCLKCGITEMDHKLKTGSGLEVNHKIPIWQFSGNNSKANNLNNLETLCKSCHMKTEWQYRKNNPMQKVISFL